MQKTAVDQYFSVREYPAPAGNATKQIFIFGGWLTLPFYYSRFIKRLWQHGFDCMLYIPKRKLVAIGSEYATLLWAADAAIDDANRRLANTPNITHVAVFGVSLGSIFAMEAAKRIESIQKVALLTPAGDFVEHIKAWQQHFYFKRIVASQPTKPLESGELLNRIGALKNLDRIKDKDVLLGFVTNDRVIHQAIARDLVAKLQEAQVNPVVVEVKGGHNAGLFRYLFKTEYLTFLTRK